MKQQFSDLETHQLTGFVDRLFSRLFSVEVFDWGALARRETGDTDSLIEYLWGFRERCGSWLLELASGHELSFRFVSGHFIKWAYEQNQFFELAERGSKRLSRAHRLLFGELGRALQEAEHIEAFANRANRALYRFVERAAVVFRELGGASGFGRGAEYSAELQMQLLGLTERKLLEPVVDLGSGKTAELVGLLRAKGLAATGIDRLGEGPFVVAKDWFDVRFEPNTLGTILSHLAFSLHFLHHHWHPGDRAYAYARKYMELLHSLKPGGLLVYAPGLPFIESMIDGDAFRIEKRPLPEPLASKMDGFRDIGTGLSVAYVAHIERRK